MADETDDSDAHRPLSPEERTALRQLLNKKDDILDVASNFAHLGWAAQFMLKLAKWITGIVAGFVAWQTYKTGGWGGSK